MNQPPSSYNSKTLKVLIVDDDQTALDVVCDGISNSGFEILTARNVKEALILIEKHASRIALVISDFNMPGGSGFDLRQAMLPAMIEIPFVILSGVVTTEIALQAIDLKISQFLTKPFRIQLLRDTVKKESDLRVNALKEDEELRTGFVEESRVLLDEMEEICLNFESSGTEAEAINRLFACAHTIKGTSGYFTPNTTTKFTHKFEDFIVKFRSSGNAVDKISAGVMLRAVDITRELLTDLENFGGPRDLESLIRIFEATAVPAATVADGVDSVHAAGGASKIEAKSDELKVSAALLDSFMERSGELTVLRNMVNKTLRLVELKHGTDANVAILTELLAEMHKTNAHMQDQISDLRKVTFRNVTKPLTRSVRDLASQLKKKIKVEITGDDLRIDHSVADVLNKCLIHVVRNSADHGLEKPEDRLANGKVALGTIYVVAEQANDFYTITVMDDGRGIDLDRVKKKVVENGLLTVEELSRLSPEQIYEYIFAPGFSTAAVVTDVSGRGVGTDMVKKSVEAIGGKIAVNSEWGQGSTFTLTIPVPKSALIVSSLLVQAGGQVFAIPQTVVGRVLSLEGDEDPRIQRIKDQAFLSDAGMLIPLLSLANILGLKSVRESEKQVVLVETKSGGLALEVETIFDVEDTVVKPVTTWFKKLKVYAGATFLGDGRAGLVLDVEGLMTVASTSNGLVTKVLSGPAWRRTEVESLEKVETRSLLVFSTGTKTRFAVERDELYRLEEFSVDNFQSIGGQDVVLYRGAVLRMINIDGQLFSKGQRETWPVMVVQFQDVLYGLAAHEFYGFSDVHLPITTSENRSVFSVDGRAVTFVSLKEIVEKSLSETIELRTA